MWKKCPFAIYFYRKKIKYQNCSDRFGFIVRNGTAMILKCVRTALFNFIMFHFPSPNYIFSRGHFSFFSCGKKWRIKPTELNLQILEGRGRESDDIVQKTNTRKTPWSGIGAEQPQQRDDDSEQHQHQPPASSSSSSSASAISSRIQQRTYRTTYSSRKVLLLLPKNSPRRIVVIKNE